MRIAIFHDLPSGGAKRTLYESMKRLSQYHILDVYSLETADKNFCDLREYSNAEHVFPFSPSRLFLSPLGRINQFQRWWDLMALDRLARQISKVIDAGNYDVVFAQPCMWTQAPLVLRYLQTPTIYYCHEPPRHLYDNHFRAEPESKLRNALNRVDPLIKLTKRTQQHFDKVATHSAKTVLVNSIFIRDQVKRIYGIEPIISYHGVDTDVFSPMPNIKKQYSVLSVGAIQSHKGFDFLIRSFAHIEKRIRPPLYLIGNMENPGEQHRLQVLAKENSVDLHIDVGVNQQLLTRRYNEARLVAYAPYEEPFGLVPLEAMACGTPVVGVREGGVMESVLHESTGLLVERDAKRFGEALQHLLTNPELLETYGHNGREYVLQKWSWEMSVKVLMTHLESCANLLK